MSRLCGFISKQETPVSSLRTMNNAIRHRGPDHEGFVFLDNNRLRLISSENKDDFRSWDTVTPLGIGYGISDTTNNHRAQSPFFYNKRNESFIVIDGKIFNSAQLRKDLEDSGYVFQIGSDSEIISYGYEHYGIEIINRLNGMFAIVFYDGRSRRIWLVRDHFGIKPLFYSRSPREIIFASEIKAILRHPHSYPKIFQAGLMANYYLQATPEPYTCFEDIFSVKPGSYIEIDTNELSANDIQYWNFYPVPTTQNLNQADVVEELRYRLKESVKLRMHTVSPIISLMSGGIDSTTITAMAHEIDPNIQCYSFGLNGSGLNHDELPQAKLAADQLGIRQHIHLLQRGDVMTGLDANLRHFESPYSSFETTLLPSQYLSPLGYSTMLSGTAADGIFGGSSYLLRLPEWKNRRRFSFLKSILPPAGNLLSKMRNSLGVENIFQYYANNRLAMRRYQIQALIPGTKAAVFDQVLGWLEDEVRDLHVHNEFNSFFLLELKHSIAAHYLFREDLSAMKSGMEIRYPYLDHELVEWVASLPLNFRYSTVVTKPLLRTLAKKYISAANLNMPKRGFDLPILPLWKSQREFRDYMDKQLLNLKRRNIFNNQTINRWTATVNNEFDLAKIWQLVTTETWLSEYFDRQ